MQAIGPIERVIMLNYARPLAERARARKVVGPYQWRPPAAEARGGVGFYLDASGRMGDGPIRLRLESCAPDRGVTGYACDLDGHTYARPLVARLTRGRGWLAGWTLGEGMCGGVDRDIWAERSDAEREAHRIAARVAEDDYARELADLEAAGYAPL